MSILEIAVAVQSPILVGLFVFWLLNRVSRWLDRRKMERAQFKYAQEQSLTGGYRARIKQLEEDKQSLLDEVQRLMKRNILMSNELRNDPKAPTEVMPINRSARFYTSDLKRAEDEPPPLPGTFTRGL